MTRTIITTDFQNIFSRDMRPMATIIELVYFKTTIKREEYKHSNRNNR